MQVPPRLPVENFTFVPSLAHINDPDELRLYWFMFIEFAKVFRTHLPETPADLPPMRIDLNIPVSELPKSKSVRRLADKLKGIAEEKVQDLLNSNFIKILISAFTSPIVLAFQKNKYRICVDYQALNKLTQRFQCPLPRIADILQNMSGAKVFILPIRPQASV